MNCTSSEACEFTGENNRVRETCAFSGSVAAWVAAVKCVSGLAGRDRGSCRQKGTQDRIESSICT